MLPLKDLLFKESEYDKHRYSYIYGNYLYLDYFTEFFEKWAPGYSIAIEASTLCQLKCPGCIQSKETMGILRKGYLKFKDFKKFVDSYPNFKHIELSNYGEIFLNPELDEIIRYAYVKGISLTALNGVNLNTVSEEIIEYLVKYQFKAMQISIDGASNETYKIYRVGGIFDKVIENIKKINYLKQKYNTEYPKLIWQFIVFGHNEHEIPEVRNMAKELNMGFKLKLNWNPFYSPAKDKIFVKKEAGFTSRYEYERKKHSIYFPVCNRFWILPQINWDGKLLGCCVNKWHDFGNVFEAGLESCLKSEKYAYTKKVILGKERIKDNIPCFYCNVYKKWHSPKRLFIADIKEYFLLLKIRLKNLTNRTKSIQFLQN